MDLDTGEDLAEKVREFHVPQFVEWKDHDRFEEAFSRLMEDLRSKRRRVWAPA